MDGPGRRRSRSARNDTTLNTYLPPFEAHTGTGVWQVFLAAICRRWFEAASSRLAAAKRRVGRGLWPRLCGASDSPFLSRRGPPQAGHGGRENKKRRRRPLDGPGPQGRGYTRLRRAKAHKMGLGTPARNRCTPPAQAPPGALLDTHFARGYSLHYHLRRARAVGAETHRATLGNEARWVRRPTAQRLAMRRGGWGDLPRERPAMRRGGCGDPPRERLAMTRGPYGPRKTYVSPLGRKG